jgi:hypothetical protein
MKYLHQNERDKIDRDRQQWQSCALTKAKQRVPARRATIASAAGGTHRGCAIDAEKARQWCSLPVPQ